jgi:hypothetical protein
MLRLEVGDKLQCHQSGHDKPNQIYQKKERIPFQVYQYQQEFLGMDRN